jgi:hypothetical protein
MASECLTSECADPYDPPLHTALSRRRRLGAASDQTGELTKVPPQKGMVWVNMESAIFFREGDRWYGMTKEGKFMTEADASKAGYREAKR